MTTAYTAVLDNDGSTPTTPFAMGNGRVDLTLASKAGLLLDESTANYTAANPATGGDPKTLNLPSMGNSQCFGSCTWTRTVRSPLSSSVDWTVNVEMPAGVIISVTPSSFTLPAGGSQMLTISANVQGAVAEQWHFGQIVLAPSSSAVSHAQMPVAVYPVASASSDGAVLNKTADMHMARVGDVIEYTMTLENPSFAARTYTLTDPIPANAAYVAGSATGGLLYNGGLDQLTWNGSIPAATLTIDDSVALSGYISLGALGVPSLGTNSCYLIAVPAFSYMGQSYNEVIINENGTLEPGSASLSCLSGANANLPLGVPFPHPLLVPFWDSLNLTSGNMYAASVSYDGQSYTVFSWENYGRTSGMPSSYSFQVWLEQGGDNIWFAYGTLSGVTNSATIGAQNNGGTQAVVYRYDGTGNPIPNGSVDLQIAYNTHPQTLTYQATAVSGPDISNEATVVYGANSVTATAYTVVGDTNTWLGNTTNWHTDGNWSLGRVPVMVDDVLVPTTPTGGNMPTMTGDAAVYSLLLQTDAALNLGIHTLTAETTVTNNGMLSQQAAHVPAGSSTEFLTILDQGGTNGRYWGVSLTPTSGDMGPTIVSVQGNRECTTTDQASMDTVNRCFEITPTNQETANIRFYYLDAELDGHNPTNMAVWHWGGSSPWTPAGSVTNRGTDGTYHWVDVSGVATFSPFTLSDNTPTAVGLQAMDSTTISNARLVISLLLVLVTGTALALGCHRKSKMGGKPN